MIESDPAGDTAQRARRAAVPAFSWRGFVTLFRKELMRFYKVGFQTVGAPILTSLLYLLIFSHALEDRIQVYDGVRYTSFLLPGLVMMAVLQNSFANSSSSLIQSKITGNIVFVLLTPLSQREMYAAYVLAAMTRGIIVGSGVFLVTSWFAPLSFHAPLFILAFAILGSAILATMGVVAGIWAEKFDQIAAFQNFIVIPATFLSGVFYSIKSLPPFWQTLSHLNPFFYMVDGFRYGFFGVSDIDPVVSLVVVSAALALVSTVAMRLLAVGYRLRN